MLVFKIKEQIYEPTKSLTLRAISFKKLALGLQPKTEIEQSRQLYHINGGESWKNDYSGAELEVMFILITNDNFI